MLRLNGGIYNFTPIGIQTFDNAGLVAVDTGIFDVSIGGSTQDTGTYDVTSGATLDLGASRVLNPGSDISGAGTLDITGAISSSVTLGIGSTGFFKLTNGSILFNAPQVFNNPVVHTNGTLTNFNTITVNNDYTWTGGSINSGNLFVNGDFTATGSLNKSFSGITLGAGQNHSLVGANISGSGGFLRNNGNLAISGTTIPFSLDNAAGVLTISGTNAVTGTTGNSGVTIFNSGSVLTSTQFINGGGGTVQGVGTLVGDMQLLDGTFIPGTSPGTFNITGNYTQGSTGVLEVEIGGLIQGSNYDFLNVGGSATLDGTLDVQLFGGFNGTVGDQFDIISSSFISGDFSAVNVPVTHSFSASPNVPSSGIYQLEITSAPVITPPPPPPSPPPPVVIPPVTPTPVMPPEPEEELVELGTEQVIVLNDYQDDVLVAFVDPDAEDEEGRRELICR